MICENCHVDLDPNLAIGVTIRESDKNGHALMRPNAHFYELLMHKQICIGIKDPFKTNKKTGGN